MAEKSEGGSSQKISILSFNFLGVPLASRNYQKRLSKLVKEVVKINPDVLCFQEIWLPQARRYLVKNLIPFGFQHFFHPVSKFRLNGLFVLSKKRISEAESFTFKPLVKGFDFSLFELFGSKGCCWLKLELADQKEFFLFNVHLSPDWAYKTSFGPDFALAKLKEIEKLSETINSLSDQKIIVVGDFNFDFHSILHKKLLAASGLENVLPKNGFESRTALTNLYKFYVPKWGKSIDFAFSKNLPENSVLDFQVLWNKPFPEIGCLSDHAAILVHFQI